MGATVVVDRQDTTGAAVVVYVDYSTIDQRVYVDYTSRSTNKCVPNANR
jgi:hypothetical protein